MARFESDNDSMPEVEASTSKSTPEEPSQSEASTFELLQKSSSQESLESQDSSEYSDDDDSSSSSDLSYYQPNKYQLDTSAKLFWLRKQPLPEVVKKPLQLVSIAVDPYFVGLGTMQRSLRAETLMEDELKRNEKSMDWYKNGWYEKERCCKCDVKSHPKSWTKQIIKLVHKYSHLLDTKNLVVPKECIYAMNPTRTYVVVNVPMVDGHPWKKKAESAILYTDVEAGMGDQTVYETLYYRQPCDRKILLMVASNKVIGLVVTERQLTAHRIQTDTGDYRDLEEDPVPVKVGINRLWVHVSVRHNNFASLLCELAGRLYDNDRMVLEKEDFAFNTTFSDDGVAFAKSFVGVQNIPMYEGKTGIKV